MKSKVIPDKSKRDAFGLCHLLVKSKFRRPPTAGEEESGEGQHLSNTVAKRRDVAQCLVGELKKSQIGEQRGHHRG